MRGVHQWSINHGREIREIGKSRRLEELKGKFENLGREDPNCIQLAIYLGLC